MDINWDVNVESLQVAEIKPHTEDQSALKYRLDRKSVV